MKNYIILILLVIIAFAYSIRNDFLWDDHMIIVKNPRIDLPLKEIPSVFTTPLSKFAGFPEYQQVYYRPVLFIFFILNYKIWGMNPIGFHLVNLLLYLITAIVIYKAGLLLFESDKNKKLLSLMAASLFAVHPLNSEMAGRAASGEVIFGLFVFLTLYFYLRERKYLSLVSFFLALLSKEPAVMFPFALVILTTHKKGLKKGLIELIPYFALIGVYLILRMLTLDTVLGMKVSEPILTRILTMAVAALDYIRLLLIPYPLSLFYPARWYLSILEPKVLVAMAVLLSICFLVYKLRKDRVMLFLLLFPFVMLAPVIWRVNTFPYGYFDLAYIAERFIYVSIMPFSLFISASAVRLFKETGRRYMVTGWVVVLIILTVITISSGRAWKNDYTYFSKIVEQSPGSSFAYFGLGDVYRKMGRLDDAMREWQKALQLSPYDPEILNSVGNIYFIKGDYDRAINFYKMAFMGAPRNAETCYNLAIALEKTGKTKEAETYYREFIKIASEHYKDIVSELRKRFPS